MNTGKESAGEPWTGREALRAFKESDLWERVDQASQEELIRLLQEDLDPADFERRLDWILAGHPDAWEVLDSFLSLREASDRYVPDGQPAHEVEESPSAGVPNSDTEPTDSEYEERHLNLCLTWPLSRQVVGSDWCLGAGVTYELRVGIGKLAHDSLLREADRPFPSEALDHRVDGGDWLQVTLLSEDFAVPVERHAMFLPRNGPSWVCGCLPGGSHSCREEHRSEHLRIALTAPAEPTSDARFRVLVSHRGNQLQSASVDTCVTAREEPTGGATAARIDHTLTAGFKGLKHLPTRQAAIRVSRGVDGSLTVDVDGGRRPVSTFWLTEAQVEGALSRARAVLTDVHAAPGTQPGDADSARISQLDSNNGKLEKAFTDDLWRLAAVGWDLLHLLAPAPGQRAALRETLRVPSDIQICRQQRQPLQFPWALVYDIPVDAGGERRVCATGVAQALSGKGDARECVDAANHGLNSVCPYGFWGFRHTIEQPPSQQGGGSLARYAGRGTGRPELTIGRSLALGTELASHHLDSLRERFGDDRIHDCTDRAALQTELAQNPRDCVYFYCHGRRATDRTDATGATELEIGHKDRIKPSAITAWAADGWQSWEKNAPLVFLNGCHTADDTPSTWLSFVDVFCDLSASGVVGTEISVSQRFANEVAQLFWSRFLDGATVGTALRQVRTELLRKGNLLGLAYTAYCSAELQLAKAQS